MSNLKFYTLLFFTIILYKEGLNQNVSDTTCNFIYWEEYSGLEKERTIKNKKVINTAIEYYTNNIKTLTADGPEMFELLQELTNSNNLELLSFYFYVFNQICMDKNAVLGEVKGKYCIDFIIKHPCYVFNYFSSNTRKSKKIWDCYINCIKYEFMMNIDLPDDNIYTYDCFKKRLLSINDNFCINKSTLLFIKKVKPD